MPIKKYTEVEVINKFIAIHGERYDYSKVNYSSSKTNIIIICKEHGEFNQRPSNHWNGANCPKCVAGGKISETAFLQKCLEVHGDKYTYTNTKFHTLTTEVIITCKIHGDFSQKPQYHLDGCGCPKCANNQPKTQSTTIEEFIKIHENKYDYSLVKYKNVYEKIDIICNLHGVFQQTPKMHKKGQGCPKCAKNYKLTIQEYINNANKKHNNFYDYSQLIWENNNNLVKIICPIHGIFEQPAYNHLYGSKCPKCTGAISDTLETFITKAKNVHGDKYDYSLVEYRNSHKLVNIICKKHNKVFTQRPYAHINSAHGCPICSNSGTSKPQEELVSFIKKHYTGKILTKNTDTIINELDIYLPDLNLAFEYNGLRWHSEEFNGNKYYHYNKTEECESIGIHLIHIWEDQWLEKNQIVKSRILHLLGKSTNIYGRKTIIKEVNEQQSKEFLNENHIQGNNIGNILRYGLYFDNELVSIMTFCGIRKNLGGNTCDGYFELSRFCNKKGFSVIGGADKLFKHFLKNNEYDQIISYADRCWSTGGLYQKLNFMFVLKTKPNYYYVINKKRHNRYEFRKQILIKNGFDENKSEYEIMLERKIFRLWDSGNLKFIYYNKKRA